MQKLINWIKFEYNTIHNYISLWYFKRKANKLHKLTGKRYHVVPKDNNHLMVVNNDFIKQYNKVVGKGKQITINDLIRISYYSTSVRGITSEK